ncbi:MAG: ABC transporter transmembrane domain-containing protein [Paracoccaceae bacterium]
MAKDIAAPDPPRYAAPRVVPKTGDPTPARSVWRYVWRMSGWHQVLACCLAVAVALLGLLPIELQRRLIDDAITPEDLGLLISLGIVYGAALVLQRLLKFGLGLYQSWLSESAILYTRTHLLELYCRRADPTDRSDAGQAVSIIGNEVDRLGGFVGEGISDACVNTAMLVGVMAYMVMVEPRVAAFSLVFLIPQAALTPLLQRRLNRLTEERLELLRALGDDVAEGAACTDGPIGARLREIYWNRLRFTAWKFLLKGLLNLLNAAGPLAVLVVGGWLAVQGETSVGVILAFVSGFQRMADPVRALIGFYRRAAQARVQHEMIARWM